MTATGASHERPGAAIRRRSKAAQACRGGGASPQLIGEALDNANQVYLGAPNHLVIFSRAVYVQAGTRRLAGGGGRRGRHLP